MTHLDWILPRAHEISSFRGNCFHSKLVFRYVLETIRLQRLADPRFFPCGDNNTRFRGSGFHRPLRYREALEELFHGHEKKFVFVEVTSTISFESACVWKGSS